MTLLHTRVTTHVYRNFHEHSADVDLETGAATVGRGTGSSHATQLVLAGELTAELSELGNEILADLDEGVLGCNGAVCLDTDEELRDVGMGDFMGM